MALPDPCSVAKTIADAKMMLDTLQKLAPPLVLADWAPSRSRRQGRREAKGRAIFEATVESGRHAADLAAFWDDAEPHLFSDMVTALHKYFNPSVTVNDEVLTLANARH